MVDYTFHIQDPTNPNTRYLYEAIVEHIISNETQRFSAVFAFATGAAVRNLFVEDSQVSRAILSTDTDIVVGVDAITDIFALEELKVIAQQHANFRARVFINGAVKLFHPKICRFDRYDGQSVLLVGSGNLTSGGLRNNLEAFSIAIGKHEDLNTSVWDEFMLRHSSSIKDIGGEALDLARENQRIRQRRQPKAEDIEPDDQELIEEATNEPIIVPAFNDPCVMVAQIPSAGTRWHQIHFNTDVIRDYFKIHNISNQRLFLRSISPTGILGEEEVRPVVYSASNRNYKIEMKYRHGDIYPQNGRPILIIEEVAARSFLYTILFPNEQGYTQMSNILDTRTPLGRGVRRVIVHLSDIKRVWANAPF